MAVLLDDLRTTAVVLAKRFGRSCSDIANTVRLLELPDQVIEMIDAGVLPMGTARRCSPSLTIIAAASSPTEQRRRAGRSERWKPSSPGPSERLHISSLMPTMSPPRRNSRTRS